MLRAVLLWRTRVGCFYSAAGGASGRSPRFCSDTSKKSQSTNDSNGDTQEKDLHPDREKEPLKPHPGGINPVTGERGGPAGPEPTRYGDWERKGRAYDF